MNDQQHFYERDERTGLTFSISAEQPRPRLYRGEWGDTQTTLDQLGNGDQVTIEGLTTVRAAAAGQYLLSHAQRKGYKITTRRHRTDDGTFTLWVQKISI